MPYLDHRAPIGRPLLNLRRIGAAVLKNRLVVVHIGDEDDDDGGGGVDGLGVGGWLAVLHAALAVVHGGDVELILVPLQVDVGGHEADDACVRFNPEHHVQQSSENRKGNNKISNSTVYYQSSENRGNIEAPGKYKQQHCVSRNGKENRG